MTSSSKISVQDVLVQIQEHIAQAKNPAVLQDILEWRQSSNPNAEIYAFYPEFFGMVFLRKLNDGDFEVVLYSNRRKNNDGRLWKSDMQKVNHVINVWLEAHRSSLKRKADRQAEKIKQKAEAPKPQELAQIGDVFVESFGYDETHYKFYQLVEFKGKTQGVFREIKAKYDYGLYGTAEVTPLKDNFRYDDDDVLVKQLQVDKCTGKYRVYFRVDSCSLATKADDTPYRENSFRR